MAVGVPAPPPATTFEETSGVIDDLYMVFESRDDAAKIAHVRVAAAEMAALCEAKQGDLQGAIRDLTRRVATVERDAAPTEPPEAHERRVAEAEEQKADAEQVVRQYEDQLAALELEKANAASRMSAVASTRAETDTLEAEALPQNKHELSLYAHVSKIIWHYEAGERVRGNVSDPAKADIRPFDMDPAKTSNFDIANSLWDLMENDAPATAAAS
eukprot:PRCOL_00003364-RA